ncbi:MAG: 23S rRNA (guanosine(2251)-2'-O)-methyltransferase RlmB [Treponema sp.]|jgi:23S rRNA (guanosine2251-2'-O)-methyltransferase|nr:23S rRNA (guanosine(2251)-2'-O)-methyltransferase RlmB [Treponema sp.]
MAKPIRQIEMIHLSGFHAIEEWIKSGQACGPLLAAKPGPRARELIALALEHKIRVDRVGTHDLDRLAGDHRGIVLEAEEYSQAAQDREVSLESFLQSLHDGKLKKKKDILVLVLDEITDPHNYGAILRSCDQFGADLILSRSWRTAKHADVIAKTSAGASAWVPAAETPNLRRALEELKEAGFWVYGADMTGEPAYEKDLRGRAAIILGGEGSGISRLLRESCDGLIAIPAKGRIDSLNVSVAAGILMYEIIRQRAGDK